MMIKYLLQGMAVSIMVGEAVVAHALPSDDSPAEIRVYNDFDLPLEPATLYSMSEYNLSICLFSTLFVLDDSSIPHSDILASWKFDSKDSSYEFIIKDGLTWSDGKPFTSGDIKTSITRLKTVAPTFYRSITSLLSGSVSDVAAIEVSSPKTVRFHVRSPSPDLFTRLTTAAIPMVRPDLLDPISLRVTRHDVTFAPFVLDLQASSKEHLRLIRNSRYFHSSPTMAATIEMRPYQKTVPRAEDIAGKTTWPNLILDRAFTTQEGWEQIRSSRASVWTRPVDRVLYMYPTKQGLIRHDMAGVMRWFGRQLTSRPLAFSEYPGLQIATSLQPKGFFLHEDLKYESGTAPREGVVFRVAIINQQTPGAFLKDEFRSRGLNIEFDLMPISRRKKAQTSGKYDLIIASFGAADPDPVTWLSLVLGNEKEFIADYDHIYRDEFEQIKSDVDGEKRYERLRELLSRAGRRGLYVPLAHFSSIAVADQSLDLKAIRQSDETVDLSKVIVRR